MKGRTQPMIQFNYYSLHEAHLAEGVTVVIDVIRAFTTAAFAFEGGAAKILPVASVEHAFILKNKYPGSLIMGEVDGFKPEGFDLSNSPAAISEAEVSDRVLIQRTSAGTQGLVLAVHADRLLAASFVVARATADYLKRLKPDQISFIITGESLGRDGDEDRACGEYIERLVRDKHPCPLDYTQRIMTSSVGQSFLEGENRYLLSEDLTMSAQINIFDFFLAVRRDGRQLVMEKVADLNAQRRLA